MGMMCSKHGPMSYSWGAYYCKQCKIFEEMITMTNFAIKDSGERVSFSGGMHRDVDTDKIKWHLIASGPMLKRWAQHMTNGAKKYSDNNWMLAEGQPEYDRFRASAFRHFMQWYNGDRDEDHGAAVFFNINGAEYTKEKSNL